MVIKKTLIQKSMEEEIEIGNLIEEENNYVKTVKILQGRFIYSDSWFKL